MTKNYYDRSAQTLQPLEIGEKVLFQNGKFWSKATVTRKDNGPRFYIINTPGGLYRRNRWHLRGTMSQ